jgi:hypothetical protein
MHQIVKISKDPLVFRRHMEKYIAVFLENSIDILCHTQKHNRLKWQIVIGREIHEKWVSPLSN